MLPRIAVLTLFFLSACASSPTVRDEAAASAPASGSGDISSGPVADRTAARPHAAERLQIPRLSGNWSVRSAADGTHLFAAAPSPAVVRIALEPAEGTVLERVRREAAALAARGVRVGPIDAASDNYASCDFEGDLGSGPRRGRIAVRRPSGSPGSFIVMSGYWPAPMGAATPEIDLLFLMTSAR
ncbi:MAG TPA: hypothetical protein VL500_05235 [Candidatus Eisenbacteria bacterium]|nr:hypothetical protein [Candidatus Eisenbacteria bacterium]